MSVKKQGGMVDTSAKKVTKRTAIACATINMTPKAFQILIKEGSPKGNVFETAKVAGVMAAKSTPQIIPLCHPLLINKVTVNCYPDRKSHSVKITAEVVCLGQTGVEMEALAAASIAALTIYDMMKWADAGMIISDVMLNFKEGGKSGVFKR